MTPEAWRECRLGDLLSVKHGYAFLGRHFGDAGTHIVVTPGNFFDQGGFKTKTGREKWYSGPVPPDYVLKKGDLVIAMTEQSEGLLGSSAIVPRGGLYLHNQRIGLVQIPDAQKADSLFLYHLFNSPTVRAQIRSTASGLKIRHTAPSRIADVRVAVPPLAEQSRIANVLSAYDDLIANNQRRIGILEEMARKLYREWFVEFRFPGHEGHSRVASSLGHIPDGWEVRELQEVADVNRAQISARTAPAEVQYIDIASVSPGQIDTVATMPFAEAPGRARRVVQHGDIIWSTVRPNRCAHALVMHPEPDTIASTGFAGLTATKVPFVYLYQATTTEDFVTFLTNSATGSAYPAVTGKTFAEAKLLIPPSALLGKFASTALPMAEQADILRRQVANLRRTRDLLLPRLLSGQVELDAA